MTRLRSSDFLRHFPKIPVLKGFRGTGFRQPAPPSPLVETRRFGTNPGALRMFSYVPSDLAHPAALVVVLHGCTQTAAGYDVGAGWSTLAERYGFALLMPEQQRTNNANVCFSWFNPEDCTRDEGEACSIRQMIAQMAKDHAINHERIFVTGLSAGGAMTSVMLATYPDVFSGGAIIAGLPFGVASNVEEALSGMRQTSSRSAAILGDMVREASPHKGPWPKVSVWHGGRDMTVHPSNADAIVEQWLDVHGLPPNPMAQTKVDGQNRVIWWNADGETVVESYSLPYLSHGMPLGVGDSDEYFGNAGPFLLDAGISSSYHIAKFFGLTGKVHRPRSAAKQRPGKAMKVAAAKPRAAAPEEDLDLAQLSKIDIGAIISKALTTAGLIKK